MSSKPSWLVERKVTLSDGTEALWSYDSEGDFLFGPSLLPLNGLDKLPGPERKAILRILQSPPVNAILKLYAFEPEIHTPAIPVVLLENPLPLTA